MSVNEKEKVVEIQELADKKLDRLLEQYLINEGLDVNQENKRKLKYQIQNKDNDRWFQELGLECLKGITVTITGWKFEDNQKFTLYFNEEGKERSLMLWVDLKGDLQIEYNL